MKKSFLLFFLAIVSFALSLSGQTVSMRVVQSSYSSVDPDGAGLATGSVVLEFQLMASTGGILADGIPFSCVYQSSLLMETPTNTTTMVGPLASGASWSQNVDNRPGNPVSVTYGGRSFDRRMIISFVQNSGIPNVPINTTWTGYARITYWVKGATNPQGGYSTPEPGTIVAQNELSTDGGLTTYPYLSPNLNTPIPLGSGGTLPVLFTNYEVKCTDKGAALSWSTGTEINSSHFEIQKYINGNWTSIGQLAAAGNSNETKMYQYLDLEGGAGQYRIRQVDLDGQSTFTAVRSVSCENKGKVNVVIYPVPARDVLNVAIRTDKAIRTELQVYDMSGRIVRRQAASLSSGNNNLTINVSNLSSGEYVIRSSDGAVQLNQKFTVMH